MNNYAHRSRRSFLRSASTAGLVAGSGQLAFMSQLRPVSAQEAKLNTQAVKFDSSIEPLVRLLEDTPRNRVLEEFAHRISTGTSYREVLTALMLAGIRNIPPRPDVGWKFHAVLCINSAHIASLNSPPKDRWLPIFYALDFFKGQQMFDERESEWSLSAVKESRIPSANDALKAFDRAMENWDDEAADSAVAGLVRSAGASTVFERLVYYGMRDFRNIGHKEIYMANSWRTLQCIGWRHAEPVMRSLVYALLNHHNDPNPATSDLVADKPWRNSLEVVDQINDKWRSGKISHESTSDLLSTLRDGTWQESTQNVIELLNRGVAAQSIHDALYLGASELLVRQPSVVSLHAVTATNAMGYAYRMTGNERTRRLLLLQNAAFLSEFRDYLKTDVPDRYIIGEKQMDSRIDQLNVIKTELKGNEALEEIFGLIRKSPIDAAGRVLNFLKSEGQPANEFTNAARRLIFQKTRNSHDYKFSSAVLEDYHHISPAWRDQYLASSIYYFPASTDRDNKLVQRTRAALS